MVDPVSGFASPAGTRGLAPLAPAAGWKWWLFFALLVTARLLLSGGRDIVAVNAPHDEYWYIHTALRWVWGVRYGEMAAIHLPVYPLWLAGLQAFGVPARLAIDLLWLASAGYLSYALRGLLGSQRLAAFAFVFLCFHPYALTLFDRALPETLLGALCAAVSGAAIEIWNCRNMQAGTRRFVAMALYSGGFALAYHTRAEGAVLLAPLAALAALATAALVRGRAHGVAGEQWRFLTALVLAPAAATLAAGLLFALANYAAFGLFARDALGSTGYSQAVAALNRIDVGRTPRHVSVTARARALAYRESAGMRELKPYLEGDVGRQWELLSAPHVSAPGEIGTGWFYWALRAAAARAGWHRDARYAEERYAALAAELEAAFAAGRLPARSFAPFAFIDADVAKWLPDVPAAFGGTLALTGRATPQALGPPTENATAGQYREFVRVTGRRNAPASVEVEGWIILPPGAMVGLGSEHTGFIWTPVTGPQRTDVPGAYPFRLVAPGGAQPLVLRARAADGSEGQVDLALLRQGQVARLSGQAPATLGIDHLARGEVVARTDLWLSHLMGREVRADGLGVLCEVYAWMGHAFWLAALGALLLTVMGRTRSGGALAVLAVAATAVVARAVLFAVLDATSWNGLQARYLFPAVPMFVCMGVVGMNIVAEAFAVASNAGGRAHG